ncbi:C-5 cytosine-specific DNA methylase [Roseiarcus fermentans]|uniref:DNA (cytosine-5-)-methyltransferase n=1 Tax=Roseiarcus fermentans TaxID=1473586 RepID=A0A366EF90_9HYPH|nr:C-5 cytosine-specific DNA methylase [Roseiarcus fermentans]
MIGELIVDSFAGGGGASLGIAMALGRAPDIAINHDAEAIAMHAANHPETIHLAANVWQVDPVAATRNRPVGLMWASPDCKHFSKAKGGKPVSRGVRDLAWVVVRWAKQVRPRVILLENVEEFRTWGPLGEDQKPDPARRGETFARWIGELRRLGYRVEHRELRACDFGAPTIRKRLFLIARRDGEKIVWPKPTHGDPKSEAVKCGALAPWRTAAEILDWALPCPSIFLTAAEAKTVGVKRPLASATMARIAKGVKRYVIDAAEPFVVTINHAGAEFRGQGIGEPFKTVTGAHACRRPRRPDRLLRPAGRREPPGRRAPAHDLRLDEGHERPRRRPSHDHAELAKAPQRRERADAHDHERRRAHQPGRRVSGAAQWRHGRP